MIQDHSGDLLKLVAHGGPAETVRCDLAVGDEIIDLFCKALAPRPTTTPIQFVQAPNMWSYDEGCITVLQKGLEVTPERRTILLK